MFLYKTEVKNATNPEMGLGLFALEFIPKGSVVWKFVEGVDVRLPLDRLKEMNGAQLNFLEKYGWVETFEGKEYFCCNADLTSFINHSDTPNLYTDPGIDHTLAAQDIHVGEEIFINYSKFDSRFDDYKNSFI